MKSPITLPYRLAFPGSGRPLAVTACLFLCIFRMLPLVAQSEADQKTASVKYQVQYIEETRTYYHVDSPELLHNTDIVKIRNTDVIDSIIRNVFSNNDITTTIYSLKDTRREDWMPHPWKTVIDKSKTEVYGDSGQLLLSLPHSTKYLNGYNKLKKDLTANDGELIPTFPFLTPALKETLIDSGFIMTNLPYGSKQFTRDSVELIFNNNKLSALVNVYSNGNLYYSFMQTFRVNADGQTVPSFKVEKSMTDIIPGRSIQKVVVTSYPFYDIPIYNGGREADAVPDFSGMQAYPNPAGAYINLAFNNLTEGKVLLTVMNSGGQVLVSASENISGGRLQLNTSDFPAGIYLVHVTGSGKSYTTTFSKN